MVRLGDREQTAGPGGECVMGTESGEIESSGHGGTEGRTCLAPGTTHLVVREQILSRGCFATVKTLG